MDNSEQIKKIKEIMGDGDNVPHYRFTFGKYQGRTLDHVLQNDRKYLFWLYYNVEILPKFVEQFIDNVLLKGYQ